MVYRAKTSTPAPEGVKEETPGEPVVVDTSLFAQEAVAESAKKQPKEKKEQKPKEPKAK